MNVWARADNVKFGGAANLPATIDLHCDETGTDGRARRHISQDLRGLGRGCARVPDAIEFDDEIVRAAVRRETSTEDLDLVGIARSRIQGSK